MRYGFTTGSCGAAAAKAAAYMLLMGREKREIAIETPKGIVYRARVLDICRGEREVSCGVEKDGGDDPDVTTGAMVYARVSFGDGGIVIEGGEGVGTVTRPGLDQPVGRAAINRVPRQMIEREVLEVCRLADYKGGLRVVISVPGGERLAESTFNPRLGIVGGISILGTTGIVEPMSSRAVLETIRVELRQRREEGADCVVVSPGNYGLDFMRRAYGYNLDQSVKCGNFIGETIDMAVEMGFGRLLFAGHVGKLTKVAGGIMNTHSREGDCRMELLGAFAVKAGADMESVRRILECGVTEEAVHILQEQGKLGEVMDYAAERICFYMEKRAGGGLRADCVIFTNESGELARSKGVREWFILWERERERRI